MIVTWASEVFAFWVLRCELVLGRVVGYFAMPNEAPIEGYVDPSIPNPNGEQDAPIIIYGYVEQSFFCVVFLILSLCS